MNTTLQIVVILRADGTMDDVSVLARDQKARLFGFRVIEALSEELAVFEGRAKARLAHLSTVQ